MHIKIKRYRSAPLHTKVLASAKDETFELKLFEYNDPNVKLRSLVKKESFIKTSWQML